jgi:hypothetical protein
MNARPVFYSRCLPPASAEKQAVENSMIGFTSTFLVMRNRSGYRFWIYGYGFHCICSTTGCSYCFGHSY